MKYEKYKDLYTQFLISEKNLSRNSVNNYLVDLDQFFYTEDIKASDLTAKIKSYITNLRKKNLKTSSINRKISTLKNFLKFLQSEKIIKNDFSARIRVFEDKNEFSILSKVLNKMLDTLNHQKNKLFEANETINLRRKFTEKIINEVSTGIIHLDTKNKVTIWNKKSKEIFNYEDKKTFFTKNKDIKNNVVGFRISRPSIKNKKDATGVHIDLHVGGKICNDKNVLITIWVPLIGFNQNYSLNISPKSHIKSHSIKNFVYSKTVTNVFSKDYYKKFKFWYL